MKRLYLSKTDRKLAGICGGLGEMLEFDSTVIRLIFAFVAIFTGFFPMLIAYIIGWIIIPEKPLAEIGESEPKDQSV